MSSARDGVAIFDTYDKDRTGRWSGQGAIEGDAIRRGASRQGISLFTITPRDAHRSRRRGGTSRLAGIFPLPSCRRPL